MLLEAALIDLLRENYLVKKKPFYPVVGEYYYYISPSGNVIADRVYIAFKLKSITLDKQFERMMKKWKSK